MENLTQEIIAWVAQFPEYLIFAIFLAAFLESLALAGILIPGIVILFGLAGLAGSGPVTIVEALSAAFAGAVTGDIASFFLGRVLSDDIRRLWPLSRYPDLILRSEIFFIEHGGKSVIIGRFIGPIRPILPAMAGAMGMSARRFILFNIGSALLWAPWYIVPGYLFGGAVQIEEHLPEHFFLTLLTLLVVICVITGAFCLSQWHLRPQSGLYQWLLTPHNQSTTLNHWTSRWYNCRSPANEFPLASLALFLSSFSGLIFISLLLLNIPGLKSADIWVQSSISALHSLPLDKAFVLLTLLGDPQFIYVAMCWFIFFLWVRGQLVTAAIFMVAGLATHALIIVMKQVFEVARPNTALLHDSYAFPSGHAAGATFAIGLIAATIAGDLPSHRRWPVYTGAGLLILLIACSRIYLEVHWMTDVIAGVLIGTMICGLSRFLQSPFDHRHLWSGAWLAGFMVGMALIAAFYIVNRFSPALALYT